MHRLAKGTIRKCLYFNECDKEEIHNGIKFKEHWMKYNGGYVCQNHYGNLVLYQRHKTKFYKKYRYERLTFLGKRIHITAKIRKGLCELCNRKNGDIFTNWEGKTAIIITQFHHWFYLPIMVWACTTELCNQCHTIESWRIKPLK